MQTKDTGQSSGGLLSGAYGVLLTLYWTPELLHREAEARPFHISKEISDSSVRLGTIKIETNFGNN